MAHQDRLAGALHAIEPQEEWRGIAVGTAVPLCVDAETLEKEGNAVLRLIVDYLRHDCTQVVMMVPELQCWMVLGFIGYSTRQVVRSAEIRGT